MVTIVILAMVAAFVALRLYTVLGRRTGHEQPLPKPVEGERAAAPASRVTVDVVPEASSAPEQAIGGRARDGLKTIVAADSSFDVARFIDGAKSAYRRTLEAFWAGDEAKLAKLCDVDVAAAFGEAIAARAADGHVVDNRLVSIERAVIEDARVEGSGVGAVAFVTVRFDADIAAITRDADGTVVGGSMTDAVPTHDLWTFSRTVRSADPNWLLVETDDAD